MVILAVDFGEKRIGLAVSDPLEIAAHPLPTIHRTDELDELEEIARIVESRKVDIIVVGLPLNMDGSTGRQARRVQGFVKELKRRLKGVAVETVDERLTSEQAHRALSEAGATNRVRARNVDRMAAQLILQRYLEARRSRAHDKPQNRASDPEQ